MSTYDLPDSILKTYEKEVTMRDRILTILKQYADNEANLHSDALREQLTEDIMKTFGEDSRDLSVKNTQ